MSQHWTTPPKPTLKPELARALVDHVAQEGWQSVVKCVRQIDQQRNGNQTIEYEIEFNGFTKRMHAPLPYFVKRFPQLVLDYLDDYESWYQAIARLTPEEIARSELDDPEEYQEPPEDLLELASWEGIVIRIDSVDRCGLSPRMLVYFVVTCDGEEAKIVEFNSFAIARFPQKYLNFLLCKELGRPVYHEQ